MAKEMKEIVEKIKAARTSEEAVAIAKEELHRMELSADEIGKVAGGTGRIELTDAQAEKVVGGGHYVICPPIDRIWIYLVDEGYTMGGDPYDDGAFLLENMAIAGFPIGCLVEAAYSVFPHAPVNKTLDIERALRAGGPVYLADCLREIKPGYGF